MKKNYKLFTIVFVSVILVAAVTAFLAFTRETGLAKSKFLVGAWDVTISVVNQCDGCSWPGQLNFFSDGNLISDENPNPMETSGHGQWVKTGAKQAAYIFVFLIGSTEPNQLIKGTVNGNAVYDSRSDTWTGTFDISLVDQDGNVVVEDTGTISGARIAVH